MMSSPTNKIMTHHEEPVYFSITEVELEHLAENAKMPERENVWFLIGLIIPALLNLITVWTSDYKQLSAFDVVNMIILVFATGTCVLQGRKWYSKRNSFANYMSQIRQRPKVEMIIAGNADQYMQTVVIERAR